MEKDYLSSIEPSYPFHYLHSLFPFPLGHQPSEQKGLRSLIIMKHCQTCYTLALKLKERLPTFEIIRGVSVCGQI